MAHINRSSSSILLRDWLRESCTYCFCKLFALCTKFKIDIGTLRLIFYPNMNFFFPFQVKAMKPTAMLLILLVGLVLSLATICSCGGQVSL